MEEENRSSWFYKLFLAVFMALSVIGIGAIFSMRQDLARELCKISWMPREVKRLANKVAGQDWLVFFVHGTFGSTMSLLDLPTVNNDKVQGSQYKLVIDRMRNNPTFWREQAVLERGLIKVDPDKLPETEAEALSGARAIVKSFLAIDKAIYKKRNCRTYAYGWSGLLSQQRRRREAIRFYNEICEELERLEREEGVIEPKIEIISHSHGGNVSLNMAGVYHMLKGDIDQIIDPSLPTKVEFAEEMVKLRTKDDSSRPMDGQHKFDYMPEKKDLKVDRLIMMGTPVQPKTFALAGSEFFGQVFNIYSDEDGVQMMDYVSCCSDTENRKFKLRKELDRGNVFQVKVSVSSEKVLKGSDEKAKDQKTGSHSWWQVFMGMRNTSRASWDPTHRELWSLVGDRNQDEPEVIKPLPVGVMTPMIVSAVNSSKVSGQDLAVDFSVQSGRLMAFIAKAESDDFRVAESLPYSLVKNLRNSVAGDIARNDDVEKIKVFVQELMDGWKKMQAGG